MTLAIRHALRTSERATRATLAAQFIGRFQTACRPKCEGDNSHRFQNSATTRTDRNFFAAIIGDTALNKADSQPALNHFTFGR